MDSTIVWEERSRKILLVLFSASSRYLFIARAVIAVVKEFGETPRNRLVIRFLILFSPTRCAS